MGIESWESRDAVPLEDNTPSAIVPGQQTGLRQQVEVDPAGSICQTSVESFLQSFSDKPVLTVRVANARLLLLLEAPKLEAAGQELLKSMLKAIEFDFDEQCLGYFEPLETATGNVRSFVGNVQPAVIIVMANFIQSADELARYRAGLHRLPWINAPVAVTMHPNALIRDSALKRPAWEDLKRVKALLDG